MLKENLWIMKQLSKKKGLPPGSLVYVGSEPLEPVRMHFVCNGPDGLKDKTVQSFDELKEDLSLQGMKWIHVEGLHEVNKIEKIGQHFKIHQLVMEDVLNTGHHPKFEDFNDYFFVILKTLMLDKNHHGIIEDQFCLISGDDYVVSFHEERSGIFQIIRDRFGNPKSRIRDKGPDYLAYAIIDAVVDEYFTVVQAIAESIEELNQSIQTKPSREVLKMIDGIKSRIIAARKSIWPLNEAIRSLLKSENELIDQASTPFYQDVSDHIGQIVANLDMFWDMVSSIMESFHSNLSTKMNEVMKTLTIISTIFIPMTFLAGVYGMNFRHMPELDWKYGYFGIWGVNLVIIFVMFIFFKRKKWL